MISSISSCLYNVGDFKKIFLGLHNSFAGYDLDENGEITLFRGFQIWFDFDVSSQDFTETLNSLTYAQTLAFTIQQMDSTKRNILRGLRDQKVTCIFQDRNSNYWFFGENGLKLQGLNSKINTSDNNYTLQLFQNSNIPIRQIEFDYAETIIPFTEVCFPITDLLSDHITEYLIEHLLCPL